MNQVQDPSYSLRHNSTSLQGFAQMQLSPRQPSTTHFRKRHSFLMGSRARHHYSLIAALQVVHLMRHRLFWNHLLPTLLISFLPR